MYNAEPSATFDKLIAANCSRFHAENGASFSVT